MNGVLYCYHQSSVISRERQYKYIEHSFILYQTLNLLEFTALYRYYLHASKLKTKNRHSETTHVIKI